MAERNQHPEIIEKHISRTFVKEIVTIAIEELVESGVISVCCSTERCKERCGFGPTKHAELHREADNLVTSVKNAGRTFSGTVVKIITGVLVATVGAGAVIHISIYASELFSKLHKG
jgi:hypothetical protein